MLIVMVSLSLERTQPSSQYYIKHHFAFFYTAYHRGPQLMVTMYCFVLLLNEHPLLAEGVDSMLEQVPSNQFRTIPSACG